LRPAPARARACGQRMADYSKWDKIADSSDEEDSKRKAQQREKRAAREEELEKHGQERDKIDRWLKGHLTRMRRELGADPTVPELVKGVKPRWLSDEERKTMAMFIAVVHHDKYDINIARHHDIINIARQNRWLEEDPGTLELLCRVQRGFLKGTGNEKSISMEDQSMEDMLISAINTLSAPVLAGCAGGYGGIYELFALIGDPKSEHAWDVRAKFMKKEYAADALFNSLLPSEGRPGLSTSSREEYDMPSQGPGWALICFVIILFVSIAYIAYWTWSLKPSSSVAVDDTPPGSRSGEGKGSEL